MNLNLAIFDLDGTLNRTELYSVAAQQQVLKDMGCNITDEEILATFGSPPSEYVKKYFPDSTEETCKEYLHRIAELERDLVPKLAKCYDGAKELLVSLQNAGIKTSVCSNASERYINLVLNSIGLMPYIDYVEPLVTGTNKTISIKRLLEKVCPSNAIMVGDRIFDFEAAGANGIKSIGCDYGFNPEETKHADFSIKKIYDAKDIIFKQFGIL